jgi:hypothetical protein
MFGTRFKQEFKFLKKIIFFIFFLYFNIMNFPYFYAAKNPTKIIRRRRSCNNAPFFFHIKNKRIIKKKK